MAAGDDLLEDLTLRPLADPSEATVVELAYFVVGLTDIVKDGEQTFRMDWYFDLYWTDHRLAGRSARQVNWRKVWTPEVEITNALESTKEFENFDVDARGRVTYQTRFRALLVADFMDLKQFPFDAQLLNVGFESSAHTSDEVQLQMKRCGGATVQSNLLRDGGLSEWRFSSLREVEKSHFMEFDGTRYSCLEIQVVVERLYGFYIKKVMLTCLLITAMSWSVYWVEPSEVGDRISISATFGLTVVAFNLVVQDSLPRVSYFTKMDKYLTFMFSGVVFTCLENVVVYRFDRRGMTNLAETIDLVSFVIALVLTFVSTIWFVCGGAWRRQADKNHDGKLDAEEVIAFSKTSFRTGPGPRVYTATEHGPVRVVKKERKQESDV